jgi:hypothetical protein
MQYAASTGGHKPMAMSKKDFIALADSIRAHNAIKRNVWGKSAERMCFNVEQIEALADFCQSQNPRFMRERWLGYIDGENGKNGGTIKTAGRKPPTRHFYREVQQ